VEQRKHANEKKESKEMRIDKLIEVEKIDYMAREVLDELEEFRLIGVVEKEMIFLFSTTFFLTTIKRLYKSQWIEEIHQSTIINWTNPCVRAYVALISWVDQMLYCTLRKVARHARFLLVLILALI